MQHFKDYTKENSISIFGKLFRLQDQIRSKPDFIFTIKPEIEIEKNTFLQDNEAIVDTYYMQYHI